MTRTEQPIMIYDVDAAISFYGYPQQDEYTLPIIVPFSASGGWSMSVEDENGNNLPYVPMATLLHETRIMVKVKTNIKKVYIFPVFEEKK